jgi:hypothetical protein
MMSLTNDNILHQVIAKAVESHDYGALWGLLTDKETSQGAREKVFHLLVEFYSKSSEESKELLKIAEGYKTSISDYKTQIRKNTLSTDACESSRNELGKLINKRAVLTKEMREVAGVKYVDEKLMYIRAFLERKEFRDGDHGHLLNRILDLESDVLKNKSIPREVRKYLKTQLPELARDVVESAIAKGDYNLVLKLNADKLGMLDRFTSPLYSAIRIAKENVDTVLRNKVESSITSGDFWALADVAGRSETSDLLRKYIKSEMVSTVLVYVGERITYFQNNTLTDFKFIFANMSEDPKLRLQVDGTPLLDFNEVKPKIADLLVTHLEKILSSKTGQINSVHTAASICISGLSDLQPKDIAIRQERIINMLEAACTSATEQRRGEIIRVLTDLSNASRVYTFGDTIKSINDFATNALERIRTADKQNPLRPQNGPVGNGIKQRV